MHCDCCDALLKADELSLRWADTGEFANTCRKCLAHIPRKVYTKCSAQDSHETATDEHANAFDETYDEYWQERNGE